MSTIRDTPQRGYGLVTQRGRVEAAVFLCGVWSRDLVVRCRALLSSLRAEAIDWALMSEPACSCRNTPRPQPIEQASPSSKLCREKREREARKRSPTPAAKSWPSTRPPNAPHTSRTQDTRRPKTRML